MVPLVPVVPADCAGNETKKLLAAVEDSVFRLCADAPSVDLAEGSEPADPAAAPLAHFVRSPTPSSPPLCSHT